jgi:Calcineurin-like phosphoesterase
MQTLVIGDIHGCFDEFQSLLDKAGLAENDRLISLGDCVDRGPETPEVLWFFRDHSNTRLLMGNHERKHLRGSQHELKLARSQQISKVQFGDAYPQALAFMSILPLYLDLPEAILVHGYFEPGIALEKQKPTVLCGTMGGDKHLRTHYAQPWYELYAGDKPILVGHENYTGTDQPFVFEDRVFGLDTSCVTGKALTGLLLPAFRFVSVPSRADHWMQLQRMYPPPARLPQPKPVPVAWTDTDEKELGTLIAKIYQTSASILSRLQRDPGYAELRPREQAHLFGSRVGNGALGALLQLARLGKLDVDLAHRVLKTPAALYPIVQQVDRIL